MKGCPGRATGQSRTFLSLLRGARGLVAACTCLMGATACGGFPRAPTRPVAEDGFTALVPIERPGVEEDPAEPLTLFPGDVLAVELVSYRPSSEVQRIEYQNLVVDETGVVHVPLADDVQVGGLTLNDAENAIEQAVQRFDRSAQVNIRITEYGGHTVTVLGAVVEPGIFPAPPGIRLAELIALAGGPILDRGGQVTIFLADLKSAQLMRNNALVPVSLEKAMLGDPRHNVRIRAGDYLFVPPSRGNRIVVLGEVDSPQVLPYLEGMRLTEALAFAGGITEIGDRGDIRIVRGDLDNPRVYQTSLKSLVNGDQTDVVLAPGDIIFVEDEPLVAWRTALEVVNPLLQIGTIATFVWSTIRFVEVQQGTTD